MLYSIKLFIDNTTSLFWVSFICVLFISVMKSVKGAQFLNITFLLVLFTATSADGEFGTVIVPLTSMYASL